MISQLLGMRLFNQSCRVCHTKPQLTSPLYGPALSRQSLGGQDDVMREVISNGTPRMPGFKHHFESAQIDAIVAYLKTSPGARAVGGTAMRSTRSILAAAAFARRCCSPAPRRSTPPTPS